ncbi:MAG: M20 family metallo-hydrolase [Candidatus Thermoplasmatota archaeon]
MSDMEAALRWISAHEDEMVAVLSRLCSVPAIGPENGGEGEEKKAALLERILREYGLTNISKHPAKDERVPGGERPNIVVEIKGEGLGRSEHTSHTLVGEPERTEGAIWVITHLDVVPPGEIEGWESDPYAPVVRDGKLYGRGVEDNGQALAASLFAAAALVATGSRPRRDVRLGFVAEEETGSRHGIQHIIKEGLCSPRDLVVVPDYGTPDGGVIEVAEKSHLQLKVRVRGKQVHASRPNKGLNASRVAAAFITDLTEKLYKEYPQQDDLFSPPHSTFEPTRREPNVPNVNTIPGEDISYMDFRILPSIGCEAVLSRVKEIIREHEERSGAGIELARVRSSEAPPPTMVDSPVFRALASSIKAVKGIEPRPVGIGGGTCAAFFRASGIPAAVWSTTDETAHEPNEYIWIKSMVSDAKVYAHLFLNA